MIIPVILTKTEGSTLSKIDPEVIKKSVYDILPKKKKGTKKKNNEDIFGDFEVSFETKVDKDCEHGNVPNMTYLLVKINNPEISELSSSFYSNEEIYKHLETFIELDNLLVNTIAKILGTKGDVSYQSLATTTPYLYKSAQE
jgi:hypothetical protein